MNIDLVPDSPRLLVTLGAFVLLILALLAVGRVPLGYNLRNLLVRWKTTLVTALAFTLVVAMTAGMLALVNGMNRLCQSSGHPGNVVVMSDGATDELFSNVSADVRVETLRKDVQDQIQKQGETFLASYEVYVVTNQPRPEGKTSGPSRRFVQMRGIKDPEVAARVHDIELLEGRWFDPSGKYEVVLGEGIANLLGNDLGVGRLKAGDELDLGPLQGLKKVKVAGIMRSAGSTFNSEVWARDTVVQNEFGRKNSYTTVVVRLKDPALVDAAAKLLKSGQAGTGVTVQAVPEPEYYAKLSETNQMFSVAIYFIAIVMAIGGVLGVMNTMFAAISQRTKDIGVLRLLGFSRWQVLVSFLLESLAIALVGGLVGCALGFVLNGVTMTSIVQGGGSGGKSVVLQLVVDGNIVATGLVFTLVMGLVGGLVPALSAMRLRPLESLR
jgi:ABC-type antimicrobial peptide transport system permease subunit